MSKILLISHIFPPAVDGGSRVVYKLGQQLETSGHPTLYLSSNSTSTDNFVKKTIQTSAVITTKCSNVLKLPIYTIFYKPLKLINLFVPQNTYLHQLLKVLQKGPIFKFIPFLKATIKIVRFKPDIIIAGPLPTTIVLYAHFLKYWNQVLTGQNTQLLINSSFHFTDAAFYQKPLIRSLQLADYLWTLTQFETEYFIKNFKINPNKIILAGNGVDLNFIVKKTKKSKTKRLKSNILFIGSLSEHKRVDFLINAFSRLKFDASLTIAGQKTLFYPQIKKTFDSLAPIVQSKIKFVFNFQQNKLANLIDDCTFLVLPSVQESFGLVIIEAWARGKPVIVADIPSLSEIVTNSNGGLIFKQDNLKDLLSKMVKLINSPKICYQYGQNGLKYVKTNYLWEKVSQKIFQKLELP